MGLFNWLGSGLNQLMGVTSSARQQQANQLQLQHDAQEFNKHAHQYEVADLQAAGLNPVLSAGDQGTAPAGQGSASVGTSADPIGMIANIINTMTSAKKTEAETKNINADTEQKEQTIEWTPALNASIIKLQTAQSSQAHTQAQKNITDNLAQQFMNKMRDMDVKKRSAEWDRELAIYKEQMKTILRESGVDNTTMGIIINSIGKTVNAMSPLSNFTPSSGNTYNFSQSNPTVNYSN